MLVLVWPVTIMLAIVEAATGGGLTGERGGG